MKINYKKILNCLIIILMIVALVRIFSGDEDTWVCNNGEWVRHGTPTAEEPTDDCEREVKISVNIGGKTFDLEIADTEEKRVLGLSGRNELASQSGMLFVFENEGKYGFWMRDMKFDIDIIFLDREFTIVGIIDNAKQESFPETFGEEWTSKYVIELQSGMAEMLGLEVGNKINISIK